MQAEAVAAILGTTDDVLISAPTASGKTEAAFLPVLSSVAQPAAPGVSVLYVAPLKALINDQFGRMELLCERLGLPLVRWHGDASAGPKKRLVTKPHGVLLITPESIEALLCRRSAIARSLLCNLRFVIVDEVHAFLAGPRGTHLASLLGRVDALLTTSARRVGLSATMGDLEAAARWLAPAAPANVRVVRSTSTGSTLQLQVRGVLEPARAAGGDDTISAGFRAVVGHLFTTLRGSNALVFGGSRTRVEMVADRLRELCEKNGVPNEFFPHHGNLSRELREDLERRLRDGSPPTTAVCTSTLELGIDIGSVTAVAQVGAPRSIASLRQRLGRAGRRSGTPAVLRVYVLEEELGKDAGVLDQLRPEAVRAVSAIRLLGKGFIEGVEACEGIASALLHQTLSLICERGGTRADAAYKLLCGPGPFCSVSPHLYVSLLRSMGDPRTALIEQASDGTLMLGPAGEELTGSRDFYALFASGEDWRVVTAGMSLGGVPLSEPATPGNLIVFAGRRWIILEVDQASRVLTVAAHRGGKPPAFSGGSPEPVADRLSMEMLDVYRSDDGPAWLDPMMARFLAEGRAAFVRLGLASRQVIRSGDDVHLLTWRGSRANGLLAILLGTAGLKCWPHDFGLTLSRPDLAVLQGTLAHWATEGVPDLTTVSTDIATSATGKFDALIAPAVLRQFWDLGVADNTPGLSGIVRELSASWPGNLVSPGQ